MGIGKLAMKNRELFWSKVGKSWERVEGVFEPSERVCFWDEQGVVLPLKMPNSQCLIVRVL